MKLNLPRDIKHLQQYLPRFVALIGLKSWEKRENALLAQAQGSPFQSHVIQRFHWLELELAHLRRWGRRAGGLSPRMESAASTSALRFAGAIVEIDARLAAKGRAALRGRLRDALKSDSGFAPLYLEALHVVNTAIDGFDVTCVDLEQLGRHDLGFAKGEIRFNIECKHITADAGRRIHQKDFYRLMEGLIPMLTPTTTGSSSRSIILVTLDDRLPAADSAQRTLLTAIKAIATQPLGSTVRGDYFTLDKISHTATFGFESITQKADLNDKVREAFGGNCHSVTAGEQNAGMTIVMRSQVEDDHSKSQLEAFKTAHRQLPRDRPAFVAVQFDDLDFAELLLPHVTDRMQLLSNAFFHTRASEHIAGVLFSAYRPAVTLNAYDEWNPVVASWNPFLTKEWKTGLPFQQGLDKNQARYISQTTLPRTATREEFNRSASTASWRRRQSRIRNEG